MFQMCFLFPGWKMLLSTSNPQPISTPSSRKRIEKSRSLGKPLKVTTPLLQVSPSQASTQLNFTSQMAAAAGSDWRHRQRLNHCQGLESTCHTQWGYFLPGILKTLHTAHLQDWCSKHSSINFIFAIYQHLFGRLEKESWKGQEGPGEESS